MGSCFRACTPNIYFFLFVFLFLVGMGREVRSHFFVSTILQRTINDLATNYLRSNANVGNFALRLILTVT